MIIGYCQVIPLVEGGEEKKVTEENKLQYLDALARYRFTERVSDAIEHFRMGIYKLMPIAQAN